MDIKNQCERLNDMSVSVEPPVANNVNPYSSIPEPNVVEYLRIALAQVENALDEYTRFSQESPVRLTKAMRYSLLARGKRLRPILALTAADLCGGKRELVIPVCVALESVHVYSLIHDDLPAMDNDDLRRGVPTCHKKFDEATAILAGDGLLTFAFEALAKLANPITTSRCVLSLAKAAGPCGMVGGQVDDVVWAAIMKRSQSASSALSEINAINAVSDDIGESHYCDSCASLLYKIHRRKTGALIRAALNLGGIAAGADDRILNVLDEYGKRLGQAFQIADDLLDVVGNETDMGKRLGKDQEAGKLTYVSLFGDDRTAEMLSTTVADAKRILNDSKELFNTNGLPYKTMLYLTDFVAGRNR